jgi:lipoprotein-anchoring transpeptidase ErfK/SrfK
MNDHLDNAREDMSQTQRNRRMRQGGNGTGKGRQPQGPARGAKRKKKNNLILPVLLVMVGCAVFMFAAWSAVNSPVLASILSLSSTSQQVQRPPSYAQVDIAKPTYTPVELQPLAQEVQPTAGITFTPPPPTPTLTGEPEPELALALPPDDTDISPPPSAPETDSAVPEVVEAYVESVAIAEIIPDTPTPAYVAPTAAPNSPPPAIAGSGQRWIDVNLSQQRLYAYEGDTLIRSFVVSTGTWRTPTVTGKFKIWIKLRSAPMSGPGYYLPDVPYIMYFYKGYGIHGTYWHNNFGTPMSHGCVNMTIADAEWVYNFTSVGTVVNVHH